MTIPSGRRNRAESEITIRDLLGIDIELRDLLTPDTVAKLLRDHGYATACIGKWGMGMFDTPGSPLKVGFDHFFGSNCQRHAHSYFPTYLYRDDRRFDLPGNDGKGVGTTYAQNLIADETLAWVTANKDRPFFLFYSVTLPHGRHEIDDQPVPPRSARPTRLWRAEPLHPPIIPHTKSTSGIRAAHPCPGPPAPLH